MNNFITLEDFPEYKINQQGQILGQKGFILKQQLNVDGYPVVYLNRDSKKYCVRVHRLLAKTYIPNPHNLPVVNHIDGDKENYSLSNLEWVTVQENVTHAKEVLKITFKGAALIEEELVHKICKALENGDKQKDIYERFGVSQSIVSRIRRGVTWPEISSQYDVAKRTNRLPSKTVLKIVELLNEGLTSEEVANSLNDSEVTRTVVAKIACGKTYTEITQNSLNSKEERSSTRAKARTLK